MADREAPEGKPEGKGFLWDLQHGDRAKWIGVGIAALSLIIAFLIFRRGQQQPQPTSSVNPIQGAGAVQQPGGDLAGVLGNLVSMISAQSAQTQQEIAALQVGQAQGAPTATPAPGGVTPRGTPWGWTGPAVQVGPSGVNQEPSGVVQGAPWTGPMGMPGPPPWVGSQPAPAVQVTPVSGVTRRGPIGPPIPFSGGFGGPEGVGGPHGIFPPSGFVQHEFAPADQVAALSGVRRPYTHI